MATAPLIVSLWRGPDKQDLVCSGLLLSQSHILTVRHAFRDWPDRAPVYVRLIDGVDGDVSARLLQCHPERDAALLRLDTAVGLAAPPRLQTRSERGLDGQGVTLRVVDPYTHGRSSPSNYAVAGFDHATGEYVLTPQDARGHSGGVVEADGLVIGLLTRRAREDPLCRALALHLLWPWITASTGPLPLPAAAPAPPSAAALSPAYRALAVRVRERAQAPERGGQRPRRGIKPRGRDARAGSRRPMGGLGTENAWPRCQVFLHFKKRCISCVVSAGRFARKTPILDHWLRSCGGP